MLNLRSQLATELHDRIVRMIDDDLESIVRSRSNWMTSIDDCMANYLGEPDGERAKPWEDASDVFIPVTMIAIETAHPRLLNGVCGLNEVASAVPTSSAAAPFCQALSSFLSWSFATPTQLNGYPTIDKLLHRSESTGTAISKLLWEYREREVCQMYTVPRYQQSASMVLRLLQQVKKRLAGKVKPQQLEIPYPQHLQQILGTRLISMNDFQTHSDRTKIEFDYVLGSEKRSGYAEIPHPAPNDIDIQLFVTADTIIKNAPTLKQVSLPDFKAPMESNDLQTTRCNIHTYWMTLDELDQLRQKGLAYFDGEEGEAVWRELVDDANRNPAKDTRNTQGTSRPESDTTAKESHVRGRIKQAMGDEDSNLEAGFEVQECYYTYKMPGDRAPREYIFFYLTDYSWIFRVVPLEVLCPTKRRPFTKWDFMPDDDGEFPAMGIGHIIMDLQGIVNDIFNKQMDRDDLINVPFGFYKPYGAIQKDLVKIAPGAFIPTPDPQGIVIPSWNRPNAADTPYIQMLLSFVERLTSSTDYFQGGAPSRPNAPRTFGATAAIIQEGQINFDLHIQRYHQCMFEVCHGVKELYRHLWDEEEFEFVAPGSQEISKISREALEHNYGFVFKSNASNTNKAVQRQFTQLLYQGLMMNPLIQMNPVSLYNVTRRFAIAHDYIEFDQDVARPIPEMMHAPMDQMEEIQLMRYGHNVTALPTDNHMEHGQIIEAFMQSDGMMNFPTEGIPMLAAHMQQHQQFAALMQRAQMAAAGAGGMREAGGPGTVGSPQAERQNVGGSPPQSTGAENAGT